jgi:AcrR family transcriptional regulator
VQYYFHGKAGLIDAMITSIVHDDSIEVASIMSAVTGDDLLPKFVGGLQRISVSKSFRVFFDVLPYALRHEHFRRHMAEVYEWYRHIKLEWLGAEHGEAPPASYDLLGLAELIVAVVDGLAVQHALDDDFDLSRPYAVLEKILHRVLPEMLAEGEASEPTPSSDQPPSSPSSRAQFLATLARTTLTRPPS